MGLPYGIVDKKIKSHDDRSCPISSQHSFGDMVGGSGGVMSGVTLGL